MILGSELNKIVASCIEDINKKENSIKVYDYPSGVELEIEVNTIISKNLESLIIELINKIVDKKPSLSKESIIDGIIDRLTVDKRE